MDLDAIVDIDHLAVGVSPRRNADFMPREHHPLGDLAYDFLHPAAMRPVAFTAKEKFHRIHSSATGGLKREDIREPHGRKGRWNGFLRQTGSVSSPHEL